MPLFTVKYTSKDGSTSREAEVWASSAEAAIGSDSAKWDDADAFDVAAELK